MPTSGSGRGISTSAWSRTAASVWREGLHCSCNADMSTTESVSSNAAIRSGSAVCAEASRSTTSGPTVRDVSPSTWRLLWSSTRGSCWRGCSVIVVSRWNWWNKRIFDVIDLWLYVFCVWSNNSNSKGMAD